MKYSLVADADCIPLRPAQMRAYDPGVILEGLSQSGGMTFGDADPLCGILPYSLTGP
jgi:hypothetical protein